MSGNPAVLILWAMAAFQVKHLVCDFMLQTNYQVTNKGFYGRFGGIVHAGCHALFSMPVLLILTRMPGVIVAAAAAEFVIHYHTDWVKARTERRQGWTQKDQIYWIAFGLDQFVHQLTYVGMIAGVLYATV